MFYIMIIRLVKFDFVVKHVYYLYVLLYKALHNHYLYHFNLSVDIYELTTYTLVSKYSDNTVIIISYGLCYCMNQVTRGQNDCAPH